MADDTLSADEIRALESTGMIPIVETRSVATVSDVNVSERIITVVAVPYEQTTQVPYRGEVWNEMFMRSSFRGMENSTRRVPVTACLQIPAENHTGGQLVGRAVQFFPEREEGLVADLKISRTPDGDSTLELAADHALAPSVGFMVKSRLDEQLDRGTRTRRISRAFLDHIAFVGEPAYSGARVLAMRSDGSVEEQPSATPYLDEFLSDPEFVELLNRRKEM